MISVSVYQSRSLVSEAITPKMVPVCSQYSTHLMQSWQRSKSHSFPSLSIS